MNLHDLTEAITLRSKVTVRIGTAAGATDAVGSVRYLGCLRCGGAEPGVWAGVELDLPMGNNDGSVDGERYFDARPQHGVLCRLTYRGLVIVEDREYSPARPQGVHSRACELDELAFKLDTLAVAEDSFVICRLGAEELTGAVRFVGPVDHDCGVWVGLRLSQPHPVAERRMDGSVRGVRYFSCKDGHGMLLRPNFGGLQLAKKREVDAFGDAAASGNRPDGPQLRAGDVSSRWAFDVASYAEGEDSQAHTVVFVHNQASGKQELWVDEELRKATSMAWELTGDIDFCLSQRVRGVLRVKPAESGELLYQLLANGRFVQSGGGASTADLERQLDAARRHRSISESRQTQKKKLPKKKVSVKLRDELCNKFGDVQVLDEAGRAQQEHEQAFDWDQEFAGLGETAPIETAPIASNAGSSDLDTLGFLDAAAPAPTTASTGNLMEF